MHSEFGNEIGPIFEVYLSSCIETMGDEATMKAALQF